MNVNRRDLNVSNDSRLLNAARRGDAAEAAQLLGAGANPNAETPYVYNREISADVGSEPALLQAAYAGSLPVARLLLDAGAKVNGSNGLGITALGVAAARGDREMAALLLERGADVNNVSYDGTPLREAAAGGHADMVTFLIGHGARVDENRPFGETPLAAAERFQRKEVAALLRQYGARA